MMRLRGGALAFLAVVPFASCGGGADGADTNDPRAVARAYTAAAFDCGEGGAGKQYDLSTSPNRDWSRDTYLRLERKSGCRPHTVPNLRVSLIEQRGDFAAVEVVATPPDKNEDYKPEQLLLVRVDGEWKVDTSRSSYETIRP